MNKIFDLYTHQLDSFRFDGVFLDRIRYPSAAVGFEMLFSCFCEKCRSAFLECYGAGLHDYRVIALDWIEKLRRMPASILRSASSLKDILFPRKLEPFLRFRNKSIYKVTKKFSDYAKSQGKKVGLDLYSYSLSDSVGQDYRLLSTVCDWMKPMIYCHTNAPAGLPLELNTLVQSLLHLNTRLEGQQVSALFSDILKITLPNPRDLLRIGIPESLIIQEMNRIMRLDLNPRVHLYPGIEAMRMADVCIINRRILRSYLENVSSVNARGVVFSWNLLDIPTDHLEFIGTSLGAEDA